jgi:hypothetical protein
MHPDRALLRLLASAPVLHNGNALERILRAHLVCVPRMHILRQEALSRSGETYAEVVVIRDVERGTQAKGRVKPGLGVDRTWGAVTSMCKPPNERTNAEAGEHNLLVIAPDAKEVERAAERTCDSYLSFLILKDRSQNRVSDVLASGPEDSKRVLAQFVRPELLRRLRIVVLVGALERITLLVVLLPETLVQRVVRR